MAIETMSDEMPERRTKLKRSRLVEISDTQSHLVVDRGAVEQLVRAVLRDEGVDRFALSIALVDDATIHALNCRHLNHDWPTDVITFPLSEPGDPELAGELVISAEMAVQTAREAAIDPWTEFALYLVHGLLHLCGYDDKTTSEAERMRRREGEILARRGLTNPFPLAGPSRTGLAVRESARWSV